MFIFLIPTVLLFRLLDIRFRVWFLIAASIIFYMQSELEHLIILFTSVALNYGYAKNIPEKHKKKILAAVILLNLLPLIYYKYTNFLQISHYSLVLPLAISFYTFQQIAFQVDMFRQKITLTYFKEYLFFVFFFPQLIAGPIVHYNDLISQIKKPSWAQFNEVYFNAGIFLFCTGLFKKVVFADNMTSIVNQSFLNVSTLLSNYDAWMGIFAYSFQIYFDFSGYADMALGLAFLLGIKLPINFDSPYKAQNLIEFWKKWHITLSVFLKEHVYFTLGGSRVCLPRQLYNLVITMTICGIWHGAGLTFLLWGFLHGLFLAVLHLKNKLFPQGLRLQKQFSILLTFLVVTLLWVLFRAQTFEMALQYYGALFDFRAFSVEGLKFTKWGVYACLTSREFLLFCGLMVIWFFPNSMAFITSMNDEPKVSLKHGFVAGILLFVALKSMVASPAQTFVYFNF
ncbi:MBOAT family O-acyltransferase [Desulfobacula toluolica]|nr:MBOAT family O-acyltransferase [Desulfobacula toluolica]